MGVMGGLVGCVYGYLPMLGMTCIGFTYDDDDALQRKEACSCMYLRYFGIFVHY